MPRGTPTPPVEEPPGDVRASEPAAAPGAGHDFPPGTSPLVASIDPAQMAASDPPDGDPRDGSDHPGSIPPGDPPTNPPSLTRPTPTPS